MPLAAALQRYLTNQRIGYDVILHESTMSSNHTAEACHVSGDRLAPDDFREKLGWALGRIRQTDAEMKAGRLCPAPERCDWQGGCKYPSICRSEG